MSASTPKICLINPYPPSLCPRLVRNADMLAAKGYDVVVVGSHFSRRVLPQDVGLPDKRWKFCSVNLSDGLRGKARWQLARVRRKFCLAVAQQLPLSPLVKRAASYAGPELAALAAAQNAALYIAHTHAALPPAAQAASQTGASLMFDAEDLLAESSAEPVRMMRAIEEHYVPRCSIVTTMSQAAAAHFVQSLRLPEPPLVLHNTPSLKEREGLAQPPDRAPSTFLSIYWFGQTIGSHSCADQLLRALPLLVRPAKLVLRGRATDHYVSKLRRLAADLGISDRLEIFPRAAPADMVRLAGEHDITVGSQPSDEPFHQMAVGNKVFTGLMAGTLVALTDTTAHRMLAPELGQSAVLFPNKDERALAEQLNKVIVSEERLLGAKQAAWRLAETRFNWERESLGLSERISDLIGKP